MAKDSTFEALALELSPTERADLLEKLKSACNVSSEPLNRRSSKLHSKTDYKAAFLELSFFTRLVISFRALFGRISREDLVKARILKTIIKEIEADCPGLIEAKGRVLGEVFYRELSALKGASRYFYDILDKTIEKNRSSFFAFLASLELEETHNELAIEADPYTFADRNLSASDSDIRIAVHSIMDSIFSRIDEEKRKLVYHDVRSLHVLKKLSTFLFDRFLGSFQTNQAGFKEMSMYSAQDQLSELCSIISSLDQPPSKNLMEAIIGFALNEDMSRDGFNLNEAVSIKLTEAEKALSIIRAFNSRVPLESILKVSNEDPDWQCSRGGGGEDWFSIYRSYWKDRVDMRYQSLVAERRISQLETEIESLIGKNKPGWFMNLSLSGTDTKPALRYARALIFLEGFYHHCFLTELNRWFKLILLEGEFYKRDNRLEFTDAYNEMLQIDDNLKRYDLRLAANGELGSAYIQAKAELTTAAIKKRKIETAIRAAETEAESILTKAVDGIKKMLEVLKGILSREVRGRFDSLSNLGQIEGKANKDFLKGLETSRFKLDKAVYLISELIKTSVGIKE